MKKLRGKSQKLDLPGSKPEATEGRPRFATTVSANANMEEVLPPAEEIEAQFKEVVAQMGLPESKRAEFMAQPLRKKYELVKMMAKTMNKEQNSENEDSPHKIVNNIQSHGSVDVKIIRSLAVLLRSKPMYWVKDFLKENGLSVLLQLIESSAQNQGPVQTELVHCMRALLNNQEGMNAFLDEKKAGRILALYLDYKCCELEAVTQTLLLFALLCHYSDEGLGVVLDALSHYQSTKKTRAKLSDLIDSLGQVQNREYQTTCLMFVNAIINSPEDHDTRHEIITELKMLGVQDVVQKLKTSGQSDDTLNIQIRVLEEEISEDTQFTEEMRKDKRLVDSKTKIENIYLALMGKSDASSHMFSIIQHLAILADTDSIFKWREIDFMVKKAVMSAEAVDDQVPVDDDVKQLRERIMTQRQALRDLETKLNRERETLNAVVKGMLSGQMPQTLDQEFDLLKETYLLIAQLSGKEVGASAISAPILPDAHAPPPAPLTPGGSAAAPPPPAPAMRVPAPPPAPPAPPASAPGAPPPPPPGMKAPSGPPGPPPAPGVPPAPGAPPAAPDELVLPALPSRKPTKQTRNLHVNQINKNKVGKTIFVVNKVVESSHSVKVDFNELQDLFANETSPSARPHSPVGSGGKSTAQDKKQTVSLIDPKRSYNISIQLGSLKKYSYSQLKTLLIEMNETELSFETITLLKKIAPTPEEIEALNSYDGDKSALGEPEKLLMELAKVPNIVPRLDTWLFKLKFDEEICATRPDLDSVILAVQELKESKKLMEFLSIVLAITNFLNANSNKKDTYGFKMNSLLKLQDTKAANNQMNLLQYIAQVIETKYPSLVNFAETDLPHIPIAKRVAMSQIKESVTSMKRGLNMIESQIAAMENNKAELKDRYCIVMRSFKEKSTEEINFLEKRYEKLVSMLEELAQLYDEDKTLMKNSPETFFEDFDKFFNMLKEAHKANKERREKEVRAEQQGHKIEDNKLKGGAPRQLGDIIMGPRKHRQPSKHDEKGFLDGMEKTLRDGSGFRNQRASRRLSGAEMKNLAASLTNHPLSDSYVPESPNNNNNNSSSSSSNQSFSITRQAPPGSIRLPVPPPTILLNHEKRVSQ